MKRLNAWTTCLAMLGGNAFAGSIYEDYDSFYAAQQHALFGEPAEFDRGVVYAIAGEPGVFVELRSTLDGTPVQITVSSNGISTNGKIYRFARAATFPGEHASGISPSSSDVFLAPRIGARPAALCVQGFSNGSGEASRYAQVYLLIDPLTRANKPTLLHLPSLLSSCRAVIATASSKFAFPRNSYVLDRQHESRVGLTLTYYTFERQLFVTTGDETRLRFEQPDVPYRFSVVSGTEGVERR